MSRRLRKKSSAIFRHFELQLSVSSRLTNIFSLLVERMVTQLRRITNRIPRKIRMGISIYSVSENEGTSLKTIIIPPYPNHRVILQSLSLSIGKDSDC
ncbi:hypothetical protein TNCT_509021 [Trichonephila clavata]|uniref:Uncharacterized protein n=1 Tax=Trichonephila clavata TaxID=2740835 RepID=A0A8X6F795_TRICU|nr:hypothetical protein TNCT_509021 [Trichonephila clavata]